MTFFLWLITITEIGIVITSIGLRDHRARSACSGSSAPRRAAGDNQNKRRFQLIAAFRKLPPHESFKTTAESYAKREAVAGAQQKRALAVLTGGRLAS